MAFGSGLRKAFKYTSITLLVVACGLGSLAFIRGALRQRALTKRGCPLFRSMSPLSHRPIQDSDYVELLASGSNHYYPLTIRIHGDGTVERETVKSYDDGYVAGCPLAEAKNIRIPKSDARTLLEKARDDGFCRLCERYTSSSFVYHSGWSSIEVSLGGKVHSVLNHAGSPPALYGDLYGTIEKLSPMETLANPLKFSDARKAECEAFQDAHPFPDMR